MSKHQIASGESKAKPLSEWIREARQGSHEALGQVLDAHRDYLLLIARAGLDSDLRVKASASDLVQDTLLEAQRDFHRFYGEDREALVRWLREIHRNNIADFVRRYRQTAASNIEKAQSLDAAGEEELGNQLSADTTPPEEGLIVRERKEALARAIKQLPANQRQVIKLRQMADLSWSEIAEKMDRSVDAVQSLWARAVERLRQQMSRE